LTARQALGWILPVVKELESHPILKMMVAPHGLDLAGASAHWEFLFDLENRRAKLVAEWALPWDESSDAFGPAQIQVRVRPFPPADSPIRQMVNTGKMLRLQLVTLWKQELERTPNLPLNFRDSDAALQEFIRKGLDPALTEFSLQTGRSPQGGICWMAQARRKTFTAPLIP
jgi:hypothetical protein